MTRLCFLTFSDLQGYPCCCRRPWSRANLDLIPRRECRSQSQDQGLLLCRTQQLTFRYEKLPLVKKVRKDIPCWWKGIELQLSSGLLFEVNWPMIARTFLSPLTTGSEFRSQYYQTSFLLASWSSLLSLSVCLVKIYLVFFNQKIIRWNNYLLTKK